MLLWWEGLTVLQKVFFTLAVPSTLILILQSVMVLIGLAGGSDGDAGHDGGVDLDGDGIPDDISGGGHIDFDMDLDADSPDGLFDGIGDMDADIDSIGGGEVHIDGAGHAHASHVFGKVDNGTAHSTGLSLFTVRGITAFFAVGGWMGLTLTGKEVSPIPAIIIAFAAGAVALVGIAYIFKGIMLLQDSGNVEAENAVGKTAQVYLTIPASNLGKGKVTLVVQEKYVEFDACTRSGNSIKTGETVHVVDVLDDNTLVVEQTIFNKNPNLTVKR